LGLITFYFIPFAQGSLADSATLGWSPQPRWGIHFRGDRAMSKKNSKSVTAPPNFRFPMSGAVGYAASVITEF
jgi:hypothetical protein